MSDEWESFVSSLPHVQGTQNVDNRAVAHMPTFVPALQQHYADSVLQAHPPATPALLNQALSLFASACDQDFDPEYLEKTATLAQLTAKLFYLYTHESFFYKHLNNSLREDSRAHLTAIAPVINCMLQGARARPFTGLVFRGFAMSEYESGHYMPGLLFGWAGFSSCSKDRSVAAMFAHGSGVIFEIDVSAGVSVAVDIANISYFVGEKEVLLAPYTFLKVTDVSHEDGVKVVRCEAINGNHNMTGIWDCKEDSGIYYVSQAGSSVSWFAHSAAGSRHSWAHIFTGAVHGETVRGVFGDVPIKRCRFQGPIECHVTADLAQMKRTSTQSMFLGATWTRRKSYLLSSDKPSLGYTRMSSDAGFSGHWRSDRGLIYFIQQYGSELFWFCHHPSWTVANIAHGKPSTTAAADVWVLEYQDIVLAERYRFCGQVELSSSAPNRIELRALRGLYACRILERLA
eukprot:m.102239 g.102239  ORF g.102239 m.102239 type:complete len:458 (-) comp51534_c0_seq1:146-1519(-)